MRANTMLLVLKRKRALSTKGSLANANAMQMPMRNAECAVAVVAHQPPAPLLAGCRQTSCLNRLMIG
eukprot:scaffold25618_cov32-Tisochrysis_lutea.AAC.2